MPPLLAQPEEEDNVRVTAFSHEEVFTHEVLVAVEANGPAHLGRHGVMEVGDVRGMGDGEARVGTNIQ